MEFLELSLMALSGLSFAMVTIYSIVEIIQQIERKTNLDHGCDLRSQEIRVCFPEETGV